MSKPPARLRTVRVAVSFAAKPMSDFLIDRRARIAAALQLDDPLLLIGAGEPVPLPGGSDQTYPFRSHAEYYYLAGHECAGGVMAFDPRDGAQAGWVSFVPEVTEGERVWEGRAQMAGTPVAELVPWLAARQDRPVAMLGTPWRGVVTDAARTQRAREALAHARRPKDAHEIALIRR